MELDELKLQLKNKLNEQQQQTKSDAEFLLLLKKNTQSVIGKIKRSLWFEIIFSVLFVFIFGYFVKVTQKSSMSIYFGVFAVLCVLFAIVLFFLLKKIDHLGDTSTPVKQNLIAIHAILKEFVKRYFQFTIGLIPVCFVFSGYLGYRDAANGVVVDEFERFSANFDSKEKMIVFLIIYIIVFSISVYFFTKWYIKKLYGNYLKRLEGYINELEE